MFDFKAPASKFEGIIAVAILFGVIAAGVAFVAFDFGFIASVVIGGIIGAVVAVVLFLGWREPAPRADAAPKPAPAPQKAAAPAPKPAAAPTPAPKEAPAPETAGDAGKPTFLSAARDGGPDDLKKIKGVGPKLEKTLHGMGIYHFDQIAAWGSAEQAWMDDNLEGFKGRATRDDWVAQAKILAAGGETEFSGKA